MNRFLLICLLSCALISCDLHKHNSKQEQPEKPNYKRISNPLDSVSSHNTLDRIMGQYTTKPIDTTYLNVIWRKSDLFNATKNQDSIFKYDKLLYGSGEKLGKLFYQAKGASYLAYDYRELQQFDSAFYYYQKARISYFKLGESSQVGKKLLEMGKIQYRLNDYFGSKESITEALTYLDSKEDKKYIVWCWNELGNNYQKLNDFENAKLHFQKAIVNEKNPNYKLIYINNLASLNKENNQNLKALKLLTEALESMPNDFSKAEYARLLHNKAVNEWELGKLDGIASYLEALKIRKKEGDKRGMLSSYHSLAEYYEKSNPILAKQYLDTLISLSQALKIPRAETDALEILFLLDPDEIEYRDRYIFLKESIQQQELSAKTHFAKMKYDDERNKKEIANLSTALKLREADIKNQKQQKTIYLLSIMMLCLSIFIGVYLYQNRLKTIKIEEQQRVKEKISKKIHDELANNVYEVLHGLELEKKSKKKSDNTVLIPKLKAIYNQTRDISRETEGIDLKNFEESIESLFQQYHTSGIKIITNLTNALRWDSLSKTKRITLYLILTELMTNMLKHSQATSVSILHKKEGRKHILTYKDNGIGADIRKIKTKGLDNIESRLKAIKGTFSFASNPNAGFKAIITFKA